MKFAQTFHLMPTDATAKNFWVHNDIFRTSRSHHLPPRFELALPFFHVAAPHFCWAALWRVAGLNYG